ncbi:MAG: ribosome maturation factor RimM [Ruminococcus sp.]|jgi:16S rRNA processing protein RimM|nr:ribosome maturation factor RimM [Ruminococcus sp.]
MNEKNNNLQAGKIVKTQGLKGEVKILVYCDIELIQDELIIDNQNYKIKIVRQEKGSCLIVKIDGITDINAAEKFVGKDVFLDKSGITLEKGIYFISDLIGLDVIDFNTGENYGKIKDVLQTGANDVYIIDDTHLVPAIKDVVKEVDLNLRIMKITPLDGLFED